MTACAVTPDGRHVVSASADQTLKAWELGTGRAVTTLEGHARGVTACAVTPDGQYVVSASLDQMLKVWELGSGCAVATLAGHTAWVNACAVTPDGRHVVSASNDQTIKVWDLATYTCRITHRGDVLYLAIAVSATTVIAGAGSGAVWFLDLPPAARSPYQPAQSSSARRPRWWSRLLARVSGPTDPWRRS